MASTLHITPEQMAECWEAYSLNKKVSVLDDHTFASYRTQLIKDSESTPGATVSSNGAVQSRPVKRDADSSHLITPPVKQAKKNANESTSVDQLVQNNQSSVASPSRRVVVAPLPKYEERQNVGQVCLLYTSPSPRD